MRQSKVPDSKRSVGWMTIDLLKSAENGKNSKENVD